MRPLPLRRLVFSLFAVLGASLLALIPPPGIVRSADDKEAPRLTLKKGDRIAIVGNTLGDRMQHDGWLETYLQTRFPDHQLVDRTLAFSGDELTLRLRSAGFGSPDDWLTRTKPDV